MRPSPAPRPGTLTAAAAACRRTSRPAGTRATCTCTSVATCTRAHQAAGSGRQRAFYSCPGPRQPASSARPFVCRIFATAALITMRRAARTRLLDGFGYRRRSPVAARSPAGAQDGSVEREPGKQHSRWPDWVGFCTSRVGRFCACARARHVLSVSAHYWRAVSYCRRAVSYCRTISRRAVSPRSWRTPLFATRRRLSPPPPPPPLSLLQAAAAVSGGPGGCRSS